MFRVFHKVIAWNKARYEQVYSNELTVQLLTEEFDEWLVADTNVLSLDALCDISFVAMGALWKLQETEGESTVRTKRSLAYTDDVIEQGEIPPGIAIAASIAMLKHNFAFLSPGQALHHIISLALAEMMGLGLDYEKCISALLIVCASNDTKLIAQVASTDKGFENGKGEFYKTPTTGLMRLLGDA